LTFADGRARSCRRGCGAYVRAAVAAETLVVWNRMTTIRAVDQGDSFGEFQIYDL
jgi:hypothetical protein